MKRGFIFIFILVLLMSLSACGGSADDTNDKQVSNDTNQTNESDNNGANQEENDNIVEADDKKDVFIDEQIIFEGNDIKVTATGLDVEGIFGPSITVLIENNSAKNITVQSRNSSVNGVMVDTMFSSDVAAGKKANDSITLSSTDLENAAITTIKDIELSLHIMDADSWDSILDTDIIVLQTSADASFVQEYDDSGFVAYDGDGVKIVVKKLNSSDSFWGSDVYLYIENNTNTGITVQARDVSINGFMVDPLFSCDIVAGKKAFDTISFMESDLTDNNITDIMDLELKFHIFDMNSWDTIKDTDIIKISFN